MQNAWYRKRKGKGGVMDNGLWIGLLSALSALAGAAIAQWGALRATALQSRLQTDRDTLQRSRALQDLRAEVSARKREEFLGLVLESEQLMLGQLMAHLAGQAQTSVTLSDPAAACARRAYAVALLYLADMRPLAKAFQNGTLELQLVLMAADKSSLPERSSAWRKSISDIEAELSAEPPGSARPHALAEHCTR